MPQSPLNINELIVWGFCFEICFLSADILLTPAEPDSDYHIPYRTVQEFLQKFLEKFLDVDPRATKRMDVLHQVIMERTISELFTAVEYLTMDRVLLLHAYLHTIMDFVASRQEEVSMLTYS